MIYNMELAAYCYLLHHVNNIDIIFVLNDLYVINIKCI